MSVQRRDPRTREEWQQAVDAAAGARAIADCMLYGLLTGGPAIAIGRCDEILERGAKQGIKPSRPVIDLALDLIRQYNAEA